MPPVENQFFLFLNQRIIVGTRKQTGDSTAYTSWNYAINNKTSWAGTQIKHVLFRLS